MLSSRNVGLILKSIKVDFKFVSQIIQLQSTCFGAQASMVTYFHTLLTIPPQTAHDMAGSHLGLP
jgi:hypothetical protein